MNINYGDRVAYIVQKPLEWLIKGRMQWDLFFVYYLPRYFWRLQLRHLGLLFKWEIKKTKLAIKWQPRQIRKIKNKKLRKFVLFLKVIERELYFFSYYTVVVGEIRAQVRPNVHKIFPLSYKKIKNNSNKSKESKAAANFYEKFCKNELPEQISWLWYLFYGIFVAPIQLHVIPWFKEDLPKYYPLIIKELRTLLPKIFPHIYKQTKYLLYQLISLQSLPLVKTNGYKNNLFSKTTLKNFRHGTYIFLRWHVQALETFYILFLSSYLKYFVNDDNQLDVISTREDERMYFNVFQWDDFNSYAIPTWRVNSYRMWYQPYREVTITEDIVSFQTYEEILWRVFLVSFDTRDFSVRFCPYSTNLQEDKFLLALSNQLDTEFQEFEFAPWIIQIIDSVGDIQSFAEMAAFWEKTQGSLPIDLFFLTDYYSYSPHQSKIVIDKIVGNLKNVIESEKSSIAIHNPWEMDLVFLFLIFYSVVSTMGKDPLVFPENDKNDFVVETLLDPEKIITQINQLDFSLQAPVALYKKSELIPNISSSNSTWTNIVSTLITNEINSLVHILNLIQQDASKKIIKIFTTKSVPKLLVNKKKTFKFSKKPFSYSKKNKEETHVLFLLQSYCKTIIL